MSIAVAETTELFEAPPEHIAMRIRHVLTYFPKLSHSMLQIGLGPSLSAKYWRPVLDEMIVENEVVISTVHVTTPSGRSQTLSILSLNTDTL